MCGIAGIMMRNKCPVDRKVLTRLAEALNHRGPDGFSIHVSDSVGLLNTRLAIIDIDNGQQPFIDSQGNVLVANGEVYNDPELRTGLSNAIFRSGSDCETPLHLYTEKGIQFAQGLRGMYGIALYDAGDETLILARDPYGIKQLYYTITPAYFAFASEPQALITAGLADSTLRPRVRSELLQLQFTTGVDTIFADIKRVLPGETLVVQDGTVVATQRIKPHPRNPVRTTDDYDSSLAKLDVLLKESVQLHMRSEAPVGLFLSGGIDSSALLTTMSEVSPKPVVALTAAFPGCGVTDESQKAKAVAQPAGAVHHIVDITAADFFQNAPQLASALDDPCADCSALPLFMLGKAAREADLKVVLSGEGADELFGGYKRYRRATWFFGLWRQKSRTRGVFSSLLPSHAFPAWRDGLALTEKDEWCPDISAIQALQAVDCAEWLPNNLLLKLDRCLMAHGIEGRTPFLDSVLSPFAYNLPEDYKVRNGLGKWLLRDWVAKNTPGATPWSKKKGFIAPVGHWIAAYNSRILPLMRSHPAMREPYMQAAIQRIYADPVRYPQAAWSLLFYALWYTRHVLNHRTEGSIDEVLADSRLAA